MNRQDIGLIAVSGAVAAGAAALVTWPPPGWDRGDAAGVAQSVAAIVAVAVALLIATQDRRRSDRAAAEAQDLERQAFHRRRLYDQCMRLLQLIEEDRQQGIKSPEAKALVMILRQTAPIGMPVDYYVEADRDPNNRFARSQPTDEEFARMLQEVADAVINIGNVDRL